MRKLLIIIFSLYISITPVFAATAPLTISKQSVSWVGKLLQAKYLIGYNGSSATATGLVSRAEIGLIARSVIGRSFAPLIILSAVAGAGIAMYDDGTTQNYYKPLPNTPNIDVLDNTTPTQPRVLDNGGDNCVTAYLRFLEKNSQGVTKADYQSCNYDSIQKRYYLSLVVQNSNSTYYDPYKRPQTFPFGVKSVPKNDFVTNNTQVKSINGVAHYPVTNEQLGEVISNAASVQDLNFFTDYTADFQSPAALRAIDSVKTTLPLPDPIPYPVDNTFTAGVPLNQDLTTAGSSVSTVPTTANPTTPPTTGTPTFALPSFCTWATSLCDFVSSQPDVPEDGNVPVTPVSTDWQNKAQSTYVSFGGNCPSDVLVPITFMGKTQNLTLSYSPFCSFATKIKPAIILGAWISGLLIISGGRSRE